MSIKNIVGKIAKDHVDEIQNDVIGPVYRAKHNYHVLGLGQEANPYPKDTEKHRDYALEIGRLQTAELKQLINGE